jgi:hypothetical protein
MNQGDEHLLAILQVGHEASTRGSGLSLIEALRQTRYADLSANLGPADIHPLIIAHPELTESWCAYSEDKRTTGGWYLLRSGEIGRVSDPESSVCFDSLEEAVAEYVVRELDLWSGFDDPGDQPDGADGQDGRRA